LKKVLSNNVNPEFHDEEIENNKVKYDKALERLRNPRDNELLDRHLGLDRAHSFNHLDKMVAPVIDEIYERQIKDQTAISNEFFKGFLQKFFIVLKIQSVHLELYDGSELIKYNGQTMPSLQLILGRTRLGIKIDKARLNTQILLEDIKVMDTLVQKSKSGGRGTMAGNESLMIRTGFILDENVTDFFKRHEEEDSIFENKDYDHPYSIASDTRKSRLEPEEVIGSLRINENPRLHNYGAKHFTEDFEDRKSRYVAPDQMINFAGQGYEREKENQETSKFNFEGFWKKKIGALIGLGGEDEEKDEGRRKKEHKNLLDVVTNNYQDDNGRLIYERCFLLAEGEPYFLELNFGVNLFGKLTDKKAINVNIDIKNIRIEYANDLVKTLAETMFAFRGASSLGEVKIAAGPGVFQRKIELWTPWYLV